MYLQVLSEDKSLLALCRDIAKEFPAITWTLQVGPEGAGGLDVDLGIWDFKPGLPVPENLRWGTKYFTLVGSRDLALFRKAHPYAEASIVLKPVTPAVVRALMAQSIASTRQNGQSVDQSVRSDRDEILQCLMEANLRLQQYDAERTNFLGRALHDFHAPLTALSGYCGLLAEGKIGTLEEHQKVVINRMHHSVRRLSRMSRAMFHLSVGRHVTLKPALREVDIRDCAEQALYEIQHLAEEKDVQLDIDFEPSFTPLLMDSGQIEQVLVNLLENAYKFTPRFGSIALKGYPYFWDRRAPNVFSSPEADRRVTEMRMPNAYRVDIADSGPGISAEHLKSIFEEYVSYSGGQDRSRGGLGLAICRMILNQHQGRIWAENSRSGAVFSFVLPLHPAESVQAPPEAVYNITRSEPSMVCV